MLTKLFLSLAWLRGGSGRPQSTVLFYLKIEGGVPKSDLPCPGGGGLWHWGLRGAGTSHGDWISLAREKRAEPQKEEEEALTKLEEKSLLVSVNSLVISASIYMYRDIWSTLSPEFAILAGLLFFKDSCWKTVYAFFWGLISHIIISSCIMLLSVAVGRCWYKPISPDLDKPKVLH